MTTIALHKLKAADITTEGVQVNYKGHSYTVALLDCWRGPYQVTGHVLDPFAHPCGSISDVREWIRVSVAAAEEEAHSAALLVQLAAMPTDAKVEVSYRKDGGECRKGLLIGGVSKGVGAAGVSFVSVDSFANRVALLDVASFRDTGKTWTGAPQ
ncbi:MULTISPECIES: hypothetical protein [Pseudomonas]|uniref:hypothetical protein n=3 Tax=Pseudomonas TaxID=286 RepID=UPI000FD99B2F|nr:MULTISPECIES: hypothetical protein [Pseudomonas]MBR7521815.1 hypothetical protein [Pseudomonas juntendi]MDD2020422.1 hypothetical protein [Pseudomonas putida]